MSRAAPLATHAASIAVVGNPNAGKTTIFNALTGARQSSLPVTATCVAPLVTTIPMSFPSVRLFASRMLKPPLTSMPSRALSLAMLFEIELLP